MNQVRLLILMFVSTTAYADDVSPPSCSDTDSPNRITMPQQYINWDLNEDENGLIDATVKLSIEIGSERFSSVQIAKFSDESLTYSYSPETYEFNNEIIISFIISKLELKEIGVYATYGSNICSPTIYIGKFT